MKFKLNPCWLLAGLSLPLFSYGAIPGKNILDLDFDQKTLPTVTTRQLVAGYTGKGLFFAQENLKDFSELGSDLKVQNSLSIPVKNFPSDGGEYSFRCRLFFNQAQPYRSTKQTFKLYYLASFSGKNGNPLQVYILGSNISAVFRFANGKTFSVNASTSSWKPGEWHQITIRWTPFVKEILLDGKPAGKLNLTGALYPTATKLIIGGSGSDCSTQGVIDDIKLTALKPEIQEQFSTPAALEKSWELILQDGAKGYVRIDPSVTTRSGTPSLQLVKTNNKGYLMLRRKKALDLPENITYRIGGSFHSENANMTNTLCFRVQEDENNPYNYQATPNSGEVYTTYSLLTNSPAGQWTDSFYYLLPRKSGQPPLRRIAVLLRGTPCSVNIDEVRAEAVASHPDRPLNPDQNCRWDSHTPLEKPLLSEAEVYEKMKKRPPAQLSIRQNKRTPELFCNGKLMVPAAYRVQSWNKNCRYYEMQHLGGIDLLMVPVTAGGSGSTNIMKEIGKYDFSPAVADFMRGLQRAPDAVYMIQVSARPYPGMDADPDEIWQNRDGLFGVCNNSGMLYVNRFVTKKSGKQEYYPSYASQKWRKKCADAVVAYVLHLRSTGLLNAVGAFTLAIGEDGQFLTPLTKFDCSPVARKGFSEFLKKKYGTIEKLRAAWNDPDAVFEFPTPQSMPNPVMPPGDFRDPVKNTKSIDAVEYHYSIQLDTMNYFAERIKEAAGRSMLFITSSWGGNLPYQDKIAERRSSLDGTSPQLRYPDRRPGRPIANQTALDSMRANGTIDFQELDLRTYTRRVMPDALYRDYHSYAMTPDEFKKVSRRLAGFQIAKSQGFWYYDMAQEFADPEILKIIRKGNEIFHEVAAKPDAFKPDVAIVYDLFSIKTISSGLSVRLEQWIAGSLLPSGVPYDMFYLSDFLKNKERWNYKTIVFCSSLYLNDAARKTIESLKKDGKTLVFLYAPGYLSQSGASVEAMNRLSGISVKKSGRDLLDMEPAGKHPLTAKLEGILGLAGYYNYALYLRGSEKRMELPRFIIDDPNAEIIGRYLSDGKPGIGIRKYRDWTSVLISSPDALSPQLLMNIAQYNGSFVSADKVGCQLSMRDNFMSIHALRGGTYTFLFPERGDIYDADSNQLLGKSTDKVTLTLSPGDTRWLLKK